MGPAISPLRRILVVDDDPSIRQVISQLLIRCGHHVDAAPDGSVAWTILQQNMYDLLVTDIEMPRVSGVDLVKRVRSARMELPVIFVSGRLPTEELSLLPDPHLSTTLSKPFTGDELTSTVTEVLRVRDSHRRAAVPPPSL
jgi:DNA-binding response OmpR family regulator